MRRGVVVGSSFMNVRAAVLLLPLFWGGCIHVKMDPIRVHATVDVNVRMEQALTDFFGELDAKSKTIATP